MPFPANRDAIMEMGADDIISPVARTVAQIAERILAQMVLDGDIQPRNCGLLYGATQPMRELFRQLEILAPLDEPLLILGETGTGKELIAKEVHNRSGRPNDCLAINCAELSPELLASELFGHERGAFTGAVQTRKGLIIEAGEGTILLDEIGDLDLHAQAKLLRVLEEKKVRRVGGNRWENIEARILLATNHDLEEDSRAGRFRPDLLERVRGFTLQSPPLRERKADIPLLVETFVTDYEQEYDCQLEIPRGAVDGLFRHNWPGNVRELRSAVRRAAAYADKDGLISSIMLQDAARRLHLVGLKNSIEFDPSSDTWRDVQKHAQASYFRAILAHAKGNRDVAIKLSGLSKSRFYEKLKESEEH